MEHSHLTFAAAGRRHAFPDEATRLAVVRALARVAGSAALLFCVVDDHVHLVVQFEPGHVGRIARSVLLAARAAAPEARLEPARARPVEDRRHLVSLVRYVLTQPSHHGLPGTAAQWQGSNLADLVGARVLEGHDGAALWRALPRFRPEDVLEAAGVPAGAIRPSGDDALRATPPEQIGAAAARAVGTPWPLAGRPDPVVAARRAVCRLALANGWGAPRVAEALGLVPFAVRRLAAAPAQPRLDEALRRQITLGSPPALASPRA